jgi:hypothetical protein
VAERLVHLNEDVYLVVEVDDFELRMSDDEDEFLDAQLKKVRVRKSALETW